jgi:hypothetical protein
MWWVVTGEAEGRNQITAPTVSLLMIAALFDRDDETDSSDPLVLRLQNGIQPSGLS